MTANEGEKAIRARGEPDLPLEVRVQNCIDCGTIHVEQSAFPMEFSFVDVALVSGEVQHYDDNNNRKKKEQVECYDFPVCKKNFVCCCSRHLLW